MHIYENRVFPLRRRFHPIVRLEWTTALCCPTQSERLGESVIATEKIVSYIRTGPLVS